MASLRNLVFTLVVIGAQAAHGEAAHEAEVATPEAEVLKLTAELKEVKEKAEQAAAGPGLVLLGSVAGVMLVFYLVNSKQQVVREQTWAITSTSISIFAAVMLNTFVNEFWLAVGVRGGDDDTVCEFVNLIIWWIAAVVFLYLDKESALRLLGYGTVYGHILGFAAIGAYGTLAASATFHENHWMTLVVIVIYIVTIPLLVGPTSLLGRCVKHEALHEQCKETGTDFFAMGLSFLIAMFFRGWIKFDRTGTAAGPHAVGTGSEAHEVWTLIAVGFIFVLVAGLFSHFNMQKKFISMSATFHVLATIAAMTAAWCWLEAANWVSLSHLAPNAGGPGERRLNEGVEEKGFGFFQLPRGVFMAKLMVAAFFTLVFVLAVFLFSKLTQVGGKETKTILKGSMTAVALVVGLSWEHLFDAAIEEVAEMAEAEHGKQWLKVLMSFVLVLMVLPAWMVYILPKHNDEMIEKYAGKQLSVFKCCGDCCDTDDEEEGYDYADETEEE